MGNPYIFGSEDGTSDIADWGPARTYYIVPAASGPSVSLKRAVVYLKPSLWAPYSASPVLSFGVEVVASTVDTSSLQGPLAPRKMHSGTPAPGVSVWQGPVPRTHYWVDIWDTAGDLGNGQRVFDFSGVGAFKAEAGHYIAIHMLPTISAGDGMGDAWLYDAFRAAFYLDE